MSGHGDSIRERRARESWEDGWEEVELDYKAALETWYEDGVIGY